MSTMPDGQIQAAADAKTSTMHHTPVKPMERVVSPEDIERGERMERRRSAEPGFWRFFAELNAGLILTAFAIVAFKTPNHFAFGGTSGVSVILSTLVPTLPVGVFMWILNIILVVLGFIFLERRAILWSVFASFALSAYVSLFELCIPSTVSLTGDMWLDLCFAVILPSLGSAIVFDIGASTGGTDILAMILKRRTTLEIGLPFCMSISASSSSRRFYTARAWVFIACWGCLPRPWWSTKRLRASICARSVR